MAIMGLQLLLTAALSLCLGAIAQSCTSYGVDYSNGGSYYIDSSSNDYFSFVSEFQGMAQSLGMIDSIDLTDRQPRMLP